MKILPLSIIALIFITMTSCQQSFLSEKEEPPFTQFADGVLEFSSEYNKAPGAWSSYAALGKPDTYPEYGDKTTAWASKTSDKYDEYLTLAFDTSQYVSQIDIYETYNPGAISVISLRNAENGSWVPVYEGNVLKDLPRESRIMKVAINETSFLVDAVKIFIMSSKVSGWNEIDAVSITGSLDD